GQNDAAWSKPVNPSPQQRGAQSNRDRGDCETARYRLAAPDEFRAQRFHKNRKCVNEQRSKSRHHPEARRQHHPPSVIAKIEFAQLDFTRGALWLVRSYG